MWDQAANYTCLPEKSATCSGGGYPSYVVNATGAEHVKIAVDFGKSFQHQWRFYSKHLAKVLQGRFRILLTPQPSARKHNIRLNVKSTGHDYLGRSNAPGTLSIWMHHLNKFTYHAGKYTLGGSGKVLPGNAVTVGGGTLMYDIYAATDKFNQTIVGGGGKTVGISGYVTGGGHGLLAPRYGLAADNVLEMEIVTPGGRIMIANEDQNRDLFWAMRGVSISVLFIPAKMQCSIVMVRDVLIMSLQGGGSTFGVITSITLKTHPTPKIYNISWLVVTDHKAPFLWDMVAYVGSQIPRMMNKGLSGYNLVTTSMPNPIPGSGSPDNIAGFLGTAILQDAQDPGLIQQEIFRPINDTITKRWAGKVTLIQSTIQYDSWLAWFDKNFDSTTAGLSAYLISRLLDENALTRDPKKLAAAWKAGSSASGSMSAFMVGGKGVQEAKPPGGGNAVNPAWRRAYVHAREYLMHIHAGKLVPLVDNSLGDDSHVLRY